MSKPKKRPAIPTSRAGLAGLAIEKAREVLQDEKTREMLLEHGRSAATQAQHWYEERRADVEGAGESRGLGERFGQGRLERRVENLAASVDALGSGRPELADALAPLGDAVTQLRLSIEIAGRLPILKRTQAHLRIDGELDRLEETLFEASFPSSQADR